MSHISGEGGMIDYASRLKHWQKAAGRKGCEVAKLAGISQPYYSDITNGNCAGTVKTLNKISESYGYTLGDLFATGTVLKR